MIADLFNHLHPMFSHFPIVLLIASVLLDIRGRQQPTVRPTAWAALLLGTLMAIPTAITGIVAHIPYEESAAIGAIEIHQQLGFLMTAIFIGLTIWRWRSRRGGETAASWPYLGLGLAGLVVLTLVGMTGGNLVYDLGVGVKQIVR